MILVRDDDRVMILVRDYRSSHDSPNQVTSRCRGDESLGIAPRSRVAAGASLPSAARVGIVHRVQELRCSSDEDGVNDDWRAISSR